MLRRAQYIKKHRIVRILATAHNIAKKEKEKKKIFSFFIFVKAHNTPIPKGLAVLQGLPVLAVVFLRDAPCRVGMKRVGSYDKIINHHSHPLQEWPQYRHALFLPFQTIL
jgi:hypothetical protein